MKPQMNMGYVESIESIETRICVYLMLLGVNIVRSHGDEFKRSMFVLEIDQRRMWSDEETVVTCGL